MSDEHTLTSFQEQVSDFLLRHRSILDVISKFQESNARVNRALIKAVTECGCVQIHACRQSFPTEGTVLNWKNKLKTHLSGNLCNHCQDVIKAELGKNLFYMSGLCNLLGLDLKEVVEKESDRLTTLGVFNMR